MSTITVATRSHVQRGDYLRSTAAGGGVEARVIALSAGATSLNLRPVHRRRVVEWLHARAEDWLVWPLADLKARYAVRVR